jgi:hypothetical protein
VCVVSWCLLRLAGHACMRTGNEGGTPRLQAALLCTSWRAGPWHSLGVWGDMVLGEVHGGADPVVAGMRREANQRETVKLR